MYAQQGGVMLLDFVNDKQTVLEALRTRTVDMGRKAAVVFKAKIGDKFYRVRVAADSDLQATQQLADVLEQMGDNIPVNYLVHTRGGKGAGLKLDFGIKKLYVYVRELKKENKQQQQ